MSIEFRDTTASLREALLATIDRMDPETTNVRSLLSLIGEQGLLLVCALLALPFLIPVSIPGVSTVFGAVIVLIGISITLNRAPWLPARVLDVDLDARRLAEVLRRGANLVGRFERLVRPRLLHLTGNASVNRVNAIGLTGGALLLILPLGLIPFSNTLPALAIIAFAMGMSQRDGLVVIVGYGMLVATLVYFAALAALAFAAGSSVSAYFTS